jgi:hypothetical protein
MNHILQLEKIQSYLILSTDTEGLENITCNDNDDDFF